MRSLIEIFLPVAVFSLVAFGAGMPWLAVVIAAGVMGALLGLRIERRRVAEDTRRTVMASVMDSQNNFLNTMVYFRARAEMDGIVTPTDLSQMDEAIRDAQHRLTEIAETDLTETRDLGGIKVLARPERRLAG